MADESLTRTLRLIAEEVERDRRLQQETFDEGHPRDEQGRFVAVDVAADAAAQHSPDAHDDKDYERGESAAILRKLKERGLLKKADDEKKLGPTASHIENQVLAQIAGHGRVNEVPLPRDAVHLFADYKHHPHKPMASLLKYIIHRIENHKHYDTPAGANAADKKFLNSRDLALTYSRADDATKTKQHPIEHLHLMLAHKPELVDQVLQHQAALHEHLKSTGKIKDIGGEPHVALTRGLGSGSRLPDPMTTSYADTHENTLGGRVRNFHNHWVPLKHVWYSYDHGPKEAHPSHYFPAQDEFLVSPHKLKTALSYEVKKLVPRKKKEATPPAPTPAKLASSMSLMQLLRKSGQYTKLDPAILQATNKPGFLGETRDLAKRQLLKGKLDPKDVDQLIDNRNVHINNILLDRPDLTKEQLLKIASHKNGFDTRGGHEDNREDEAMQKLYKQIGKHNAEGSAIDHIVRTGGNDAIQYLLKYGKHLVRPEHIFKIVTGRKDLDAATMNKVVDSDQFDKGSLDEMLSNPHASAIVNAVHKFGEDAPATVVERALTHENPEVRKGVMEGRSGYYGRRSNGDVPISESQIKRALDDQNDDVRENAAKRANTAPLARHILDNHLDDPSAHQMLHNMLHSGTFGRYRETDEDKDWLESNDLARIIDHGVAKDHALLDDSGLRNRKHVPSESIMKILSIPDKKADHVNTAGIKASWIAHPGITPAHIDKAMEVSKDPSVLEAISHRKDASAEQLRQAWGFMPKDKKSDYGRSSLAGWMDNQNTPTDVLNEAAKIHENVGHVRSLINHPNLDPKTLKAFQGHENAQYRAWAAENPRAQADHIAIGLDDKDKTVRHAWMTNPNLTPEHLAIALKDRAPSNRVVAVAHPNMTPELLAHVMKKDKDEETRATAMAHPKATKEMMTEAVKGDVSPRIRIAALKHTGLTPDLIEHVLKHDSNADLREKILQHPSVTPDLVRHVAINDPDQRVRMAALSHPLADDSVISEAIAKNPTFDMAEAMSRNQKLKPEHMQALYEAARKHYDAMPEKDDGSPSWDRHGRTDAMNTMANFVRRPGAPASIIQHFVGTAPIPQLRSLLAHDANQDRIGKPSLSHEDLHMMFKRADEHVTDDDRDRGNDAAQILRQLPMHPDFKESGLLDRYADSNDEVYRIKAAQHPQLDPDRRQRLATDPNHEVRHAIAQSEGMNDELAAKMLENENDHNVLHALVVNPHLKHNHHTLERFLTAAQHTGDESKDDDLAEVRAAVMRHPNATVHMLQRGVKDTNARVKRAAGHALSHENPDAYNQALEGAHEIDIHPATEKLKHLKGQVQEAGGKVHKKDLPNQGQGLPGQLWDATGHLTPETIEKHLGSMPHARYNVSYGTWHGAQMHDENDPDAKPQKVLRLNLTNDHVRQLKEQGLMDTFKKMHHLSFRSSHPVDSHSLGWARIDNSHPGHWHIDEIQSDFGQNTIRQVEEMKRQQDEGGGPGRDPSAKPFGNTPLETVIDHLKKIGKIFSGPFKNINHAIGAAVHAQARKEGVQSTSMDKLEDQMTQSGMNTKKAPPGHMINTYKQIPEDIGYKDKPKKEVMPNTKAPEAEVQHRKLVKSIEKLRGLVGQLKSTTSGRHSEAPAKEAGGKYAPVAKKPADKPHIRADTQTEVNLKLEKAEIKPIGGHAAVDPSHFGPVHVSSADGTIMVQALTGPHRTKAGDGSEKSWYYFDKNPKTGLIGAKHADPEKAHFHKDLFEKVIAPHFEKQTGKRPGYDGVTNPGAYIVNGKPNPRIPGNPYVKEQAEAPVLKLDRKGK